MTRWLCQWVLFIGFFCYSVNLMLDASRKWREKREQGIPKGWHHPADTAITLTFIWALLLGSGTFFWIFGG